VVLVEVSDLEAGRHLGPMLVVAEVACHDAGILVEALTLAIQQAQNKNLAG